MSIMPDRAGKEKQMRKKDTISTLMFFLSPLFTILILEILRKPYLAAFFKTGFVSVFSKYLLSYIVIFSIQYALSKLFFKRVVSVYFTNIVLFILAFVTAVMVIITGDPLLPADLVQAKDIKDIVAFVEIPWKPYMLLSIAALVTYLFAYTHLERMYAEKRERKYIHRILMSVLAYSLFGFTFFMICLSPWMRSNVFDKISLKISGYYTIADYQKNGFLLTFFPHVGDLVVETPKGYNEEKINEIYEKNSEIKKDFANRYELDAENVNVIAIQSESLWDPMKMKNISLSADPLKNMRKLGREGEMGTLLSPVFGCNTCVPEFEFLTGFSSYFLSSGAYPYSQYVHKSTPSLPSNYKKNGYVTYGLHTYDKYFYGRNKAYGLLGFDKFVGKSDLENPEIKGTYISDDEVTRQIIKMFEEKGDNPLFLYAITMQNHGNYLKQRYDNYDIKVNSNVLEENDLMGLRDGVQGVHDADKALADLADYFRKTEEPVLIVIYGDHLPFLGLNSSTYYATGFLEGDSFADNPQMYETPYLVWANFDISKVDLPERLSPAHLGMETLKLSNIKKTDWQMRFFDSFYSKYSALQHTFVTDSKGEYIDIVDNENLNDYRYIQYDVLNGDRFCLGGAQ